MGRLGFLIDNYLRLQWAWLPCSGFLHSKLIKYCNPSRHNFKQFSLLWSLWVISSMWQMHAMMSWKANSLKCMSAFQHSGPMTLTLFGQRVFAAVLIERVSRWGPSGLYVWILEILTRVLEKTRERETQRQGGHRQAEVSWSWGQQYLRSQGANRRWTHMESFLSESLGSGDSKAHLIWTSSLKNSEKVSLCCLSCYVHVDLLWQHLKTLKSTWCVCVLSLPNPICVTPGAPGHFTKLPSWYP